MDIEKILEGFDKKNDVLNYIEKIKTDSALEASRKANSEAKGLRTRLKSIYDKFGLESDDPESETKIGDIAEVLKNPNKNPEITALNKKIETIMKELDGEKKEKQGLKKENYHKKLTELIKGEMKANKALDDDLADVFLSKIDISDLNTPIENLVFNDGKPISQGIKEYFTSKPHLTANTSHPGGGSHGDNGTARTVATKEMTASQKIAVGFGIK
jgi:hypothetical protein